MLSLQSLSIFVNLSRIVRMMISIDYLNIFKDKLFIEIETLFEQLYNLSLLIICGNFHKSNLDQSTNNLYSILPRRLKHLEISIDVLEQIEIILKRCENLSTIRLNNNDRKFIVKVINWFNNNTINTTCQASREGITIWYGKKQISLC